MLVRPHKQAGFSLIELVIGLAVFAMLVAFAIPGARTWLQNSNVRSVTDSIQNGLQLARAEAVRRNVFATYTTSGTGWTVTAGGATVQVGTSESAGTATVTASQNAVTFSGVGWVTPVPASTITFDVTNPTGGTCVAASGKIRCLRVTVTAGGQIRMCDPAATSGTAAACS
jgi:type IV fimbrial biogenesis protein FimT